MYLAEVKACSDHKELFSAVSVTAIYTGFTSYYVLYLMWVDSRYHTIVAFRSMLA